MLQQTRYSCLLIEKDFKLVGIFTERDAIKAVSAGINFKETDLATVMSQVVTTLKKNEEPDLFAILDLFKKHRIRHLPVIDERGHILGLICSSSLRQAIDPEAFLALRKVADVMVSQVVNATPQTSILEVARHMAENRVSCVVIAQIDENNQTIPLGIVTERDIIQFQALEINLALTQVGEVMSAPLVLVHPEDSLVQIQEKMHRHHVRRFVVSGDLQQLLGIVTQSSLLQAIDPLTVHGVISALKTAIEERTKDLEQEVIQRQQLAEKLQYQVRREQLIKTTTQRILQSLDLSDILNATVEEVRGLLNADRVLITQQQTNRQEVVVAESVDSACPSLLGWQLPPQFTLLRSSSSEYPLPVLSVDNIELVPFDQSFKQTLLQIGVKSYITIPIVKAEHLWGHLVAHHCSAPKRWQKADIELLKELTVSISIAVRQSELHKKLIKSNNQLTEKVQKRTEQLQRSFQFEALVRKITERVRSSLEEEQCLQVALQELTKALCLLYSNIISYTSPGWQVEFFFEHSDIGLSFAPNMLPETDFPDIYRQIAERKTLQFCPLRSALSSQQLSSKNKDKPYFNVLITAIDDNQNILGDLLLVRSADRIFSPSEIRLVNQVAGQCAVAIRQARLFQESQTQIEALEEVNRLKDDFLSTVSHELRTPITSIKVASDLLELGLESKGMLSSPDSPIRRHLRILKNECDREIRLIDDLLEFQYMDREVPSAPELIELSHWLPPLLKPFRERAQQHDQSFGSAPTKVRKLS